MGKDRTSIIEIISEMLENTDPCGIYNTSAAFDKLESLVTEARVRLLDGCMPKHVLP